MEKCPKCGKSYISTNRFRYLTIGDKNLLVCPFCIRENQRERKRLESKTPTEPISIARKVAAAILIFFAIVIIIMLIQDSFKGIGIHWMMDLVGSSIWFIPMFIISYYLLKKKKIEQGKDREYYPQVGKELNPDQNFCSFK